MLGAINPKDRELAHMLIHHSTKAKAGELVFIQCNGFDTVQLGAACVEEATKVGAAAYLHINDPEVMKLYLNSASEETFKRLAQFELKQMKDADCFIGIRGTDNPFELSDVPAKQMEYYSKHVVGPVHIEERVKNTRWVVLRYPNSSMAQMAGQSTASFQEFYYKVCLVDYHQMAIDALPLKALMEKTDKVHIKGPGTDFTFSIKDIPAIPCCGEMNVPDGECFTAPVKTSINGTVAFNTPTLLEGTAFENIKLTFENGKVINAVGATDEQTEKLNEVLDRDEGSRYIGEFALGFNPHILKPMRDILFDEKICGSFHMALGKAYEDAFNGNISDLHWDLVCIQRPEYGGGEIWFDDILIRKDGIFTLSELAPLNPKP